MARSPSRQRREVDPLSPEASPDLPRPGTADSILALSLAGGGARAAYQVGVLRYIGKRRPRLAVPILTGVSAGAINAVFLASHTGDFRTRTEALGDKWCALTIDRVFRADFASMSRTALRWLLTLISGGRRIAPEARSLLDTSPLRRFLDACIDSRGIAANLESGALHALAVSVTAYDTGQTTTFVDGAPGTEMWERPLRASVRGQITVDHVMASSALPILFPAVGIGGRYYGDGSIRHPAPLAPAVHLGAGRIIAVSARYPRTAAEARLEIEPGYPPPARIIGLMFNSIFLDTLDADAARLKRINRTLSHIPEDVRRDYPLRPIDLMVIRPSRDLGKLALEYQDNLPRTLRFFVKGLGTQRGGNADFISYLLFDPGYIGRLQQLGEEDAERQWPSISKFLGGGE